MQRAECITLFSIHLQEYSCTFRGGFWNYFSMGELPVESCTFCSVDQFFFLGEPCFSAKARRKQ